MATDNLFNKSADEIIKGSNIISITKRTVRFGSDVYQFKNVTGFGLFIESSTRIPKIILNLATLFTAISLIGGMTAQTSGVLVVGLFSLILTIVLYSINNNPAKIYGLKLYLPANESKIFISQDDQGIRNIIANLYEFMETEDDINKIATITIDQRHAQIGIGYAENINPR